MATTLFSLIAGAFMIAGGLVGVTIGLRRALAIGLSLAFTGEMVAALSPNIFAFTWGGRVIMDLAPALSRLSVLGLVAAPSPRAAAGYRVRYHCLSGRTLDTSLWSPGHRHGSSGFRLTFAIMAVYFVLVLCCT